MKRRLRIALGALALILSLAAVLGSGSAESLRVLQDPIMPQPSAQNKTVYVCACLKDKSCVCMTEAKTEGPCSCGTAGGPPMKAVPQNSKWAKTNRYMLAH